MSPALLWSESLRGCDWFWRVISRGAYGVRGACSRCRTSWVVESGSKLHALHTLRVARLRFRRLGICWPASLQFGITTVMRNAAAFLVTLPLASPRALACTPGTFNLHI